MDTGLARLAARLDQEPPTCLRLDCRYPAPLGKYCAFHTGQELRKPPVAKRDYAAERLER